MNRRILGFLEYSVNDIGVVSSDKRWYFVVSHSGVITHGWMVIAIASVDIVIKASMIP